MGWREKKKIEAIKEVRCKRRRRNGKRGVSEDETGRRRSTNRGIGRVREDGLRRGWDADELVD